MTETFVLDSFAVLALLGREPGSQEVAKLLRKAQEEEICVLMTWVNAGEVAYIVERRWGLERLYAALAMLEATALEIVPVERELALMAAHIKAEHAIAYADAFAAALAKRNAATPVTSDPAFKLLEGILDIHWLPQQEPWFILPQGSLTAELTGGGCPLSPGSRSFWTRFSRSFSPLSLLDRLGQHKVSRPGEPASPVTMPPPS